MQCEQCHSNPGQPFTFYYGKKLSESTTQLGSQRTTTTRYRIGGQVEVHLCEKCASRNIRDWAGILALLALGLVFLGLALWGYNYMGEITLFAVCPGIIALAPLGGLLGLIADDAKTIGENKAISFRREALEKLGYDTFWNSRAYSRLNK